jgi:hypothetical protein
MGRVSWRRRRRSFLFLLCSRRAFLLSSVSSAVSNGDAAGLDWNQAGRERARPGGPSNGIIGSGRLGYMWAELLLQEKAHLTVGFP